MKKKGILIFVFLVVIASASAYPQIKEAKIFKCDGNKECAGYYSFRYDYDLDTKRILRIYDEVIYINPVVKNRNCVIQHELGHYSDVHKNMKRFSHEWDNVGIGSHEQYALNYAKNMGCSEASQHGER